MHYDYLIAGAGLFGAVFAHEMHKQGRKVLVVEKRDHIAGNIYTEKVMGINVHRYGAHIFHTSDEEVWNYVNQYARFNHYVNSPVAVYRDELYNLPFNMNTFSRMWNIKTPKEAKEIIAKQTGEFAGITPQNLEEQALQLAGRDVYEKLVKGIRRSSGGVTAKTFRRLLSAACHFGLPMITTILMTVFRESPRVVIRRLLRNCWKTFRF